MSKPTKVTGLWRTRSGSGYGVKLKADIIIPAGARLHLSKIREGDRKENGPALELVYFPPEDAPTVDQRRDAPDKLLTPAQVRGAGRSQAPADFDDEVPF